MQKLLKLATLPSLVLLLSGCAHTADIVNQLKGDGATVSGNITLVTPWGTEKLQFLRVGATNVNATVTPDGAVTINPPK